MLKRPKKKAYWPAQADVSMQPGRTFLEQTGAQMVANLVVKTPGKADSSQSPTSISEGR
jgi:hypothetical protein